MSLYCNSRSQLVIEEVRARTQGRDLKVSILFLVVQSMMFYLSPGSSFTVEGATAVKDAAYCLIYLLPLAHDQLVFVYSPRPSAQEIVLPSVGCTHPIPIINPSYINYQSRQSLPHMPTDQPNVGNSSAETPQIMLGCMNAAVKANQNIWGRGFANPVTF